MNNRSHDRISDDLIDHVIFRIATRLLFNKKADKKWARELADYFIKEYDLQKLEVPNPQSVQQIIKFFPSFHSIGPCDLEFVSDLQELMIEYDVPDDAFEQFNFISHQAYNYLSPD